MTDDYTPKEEREVVATLRRMRRSAKDALLLKRHGVALPDLNRLSYFGGRPRLPPDLRWPETNTASGQTEALTFIGQIDLNELPRMKGRRPLPLPGTLYFFLNTGGSEDQTQLGRVLYSPHSSGSFVEAQPPENLMALGGNTYPTRAWLAPNDPKLRADFKYGLDFLPVSTVLRSDSLFPNYDAHHRHCVAEHDKLFGPHSRNRTLPPWLESPRWRFVNNCDLLFDWPVAPAFIYDFVRFSEHRLTHDPYYHKDDRSIAEQLPQLQTLAADEFNLWNDEQRAAPRALICAALDNEQRGLLRDVERAAIFTAQRGFASGALPMGERTLTLRSALEQNTLFWRIFEHTHQMLGWGYPVQEAPIEHAEKVLLLQLNGDGYLGWQHGDEANMVQFWLHPKDLHARRFDRTIVTWEFS